MTKKLTCIFSIICTILVCFAFAACSSKDEDDTAVTTKTKLSSCASLKKSFFTYDGTEQKPEIVVEFGKKVYVSLTESNDEFVVSYNNNVNAGTASATIKATDKSDKFEGECTLKFTIKPSTGDAQNLEELGLLLQNDNCGTIDYQAGLIIPDDYTLSIPEGKTICFDSNGEDFSIINNGTIINDGIVYFNKKEAHTECIFDNNGSYINNGSFFVCANAELFNYGTFTNNSLLKVKTYGTIYSNSQIEDVEREMLGSYYRRYSLSQESYSLALSAYSFDYNKSNRTPTVSVRINNRPNDLLAAESNYEVQYENNKDVGTATVRIVALKRAQKVFGEKSTTFVINAVPISVSNNVTLLMSALADTNYKQITANGITMNQITVNEGQTLTLKGTSSLVSMLNAGIVTNNGAIVNDGTLFIAGTIVNNGSFTNNESKKIYMKTNSAISNNTIINSGTVYANENIATVATGLVVRTEITNADYEFFSDNLAYNETAQKPSIVFDTTVADGTYIVSCLSNTQTEIETPTDVGSYYAKLLFLDNSETYYGETTKQYSIVASSVSVSNRYRFLQVIPNTGYNKVVVEANIELSSSDTLTIRLGCELYINTNITLVVQNTLTNNGTITNEGNLVAGYYYDVNSVVPATIVNSGTIVNNGAIYVNDNETVGLGESVVYVRKNIEDLSCTLNEYDHNYDNTLGSYAYSIDPEPIVKDGETVILRQYNFNVEYKNNEGVGSASMTVLASNSSQLLYGKKELAFSIIPGTITITTLAQLRSTLLDINPKNNKSNWGMVTVGASEISLADASITIQPDVVLNCEEYIVYTNYPAIIINKGTILVRDVMYGSGCVETNGGKFVCHASTAVVFNNAVNTARPVDIVYLEADILEDITIDFWRRSVTIDLQGHKLGKKLTVDDCDTNDSGAICLTIVSTGETKGSIGDGTYAKSLVVDFQCNTRASITIDNTKINGIDYGSYTNQVKLSGSCETA